MLIREQLRLGQRCVDNRYAAVNSGEERGLDDCDQFKSAVKSPWNISCADIFLMDAQTRRKLLI
jgi:hypothetical protein